MSNPNKRRCADKTWGWASASVGSFIKASGGGETSPVAESGSSVAGDLIIAAGSDIKASGRGGGGSNSGGRSQGMVPRNMRRRSVSVQALPTFGACKSPFATSEDLGQNSTKRELRPGADASIIVQNYYGNLPSTRTRAPFALDGDKLKEPRSQRKMKGSFKLYGIGAAQGFNIISNETV